MNWPALAVIGGIGLMVSWLLDHFLNPLLARRNLKKFLKTARKVDPRALEKSENGTVKADAEGLWIKYRKGVWHELQWRDIEEIHAFKRDLFMTDLLCLAFKRQGKAEYYEIDEDMVGYHDLLEILPDRFPKFTLDWSSEVAFPAFKTNHRVIWRRAPIES